MKYAFSIMRLQTDHVEEVCRDIEFQYNSGITQMPLFFMTLVPEGQVPKNKAAILCEQYDKFKEILDKKRIPSGILVQATIGHGWLLGETFPYRKFVGIDGEVRDVVCPYDEGFHEYIRLAMQTIATHKPDHIMVDDDLRLMHRLGGGCTCPLHLKRFNEICNTSFTREELAAAVLSEEGKNEEYKEAFRQTQREPVISVAKIMREAIDSVDPSIPASYSCVGNPPENGWEIAQILAGKGNKVIVRVNNGYYCQQGLKEFTGAFCRAATQYHRVKDQVDVVLAETDTCPQNRYSTGAMSLHTHFVGSLLEGLSGAKHWITRSTFEPESGTAYRKILSKYNGFYDALTEIFQKIERWYGMRMPISTKEYFTIRKNWSGGDDTYNQWGRSVFSKLGLPMYFSAEPGGVTCLVDSNLKMTDNELIKTLSGTVILSGDSAKAIYARGFGSYIGAEIKEASGKPANAEVIFIDGAEYRVSPQKKIKEIVIKSNDVKISSKFCNTVDGVELEELFPSCITYKNELGGEIITFAGSPDIPFHILDTFSFLNYSRKKQFVSLLKTTGHMPAYCRSDEELYFKCAKMNDGRLMCAVFNLGFDPMECVDMYFEKTPKKITCLMPNGEEKEVNFSIGNEGVTVDCACNTLEPLVIFAESEK